MKLIYHIFFLAVLFTATSCKHAATIHITGILDSADGTKIRLVSKDFKTCYDSTTVIKGKFAFSTVTLPKDGFYMIDYDYRGSWGTCKCPWAHANEFYAENNSTYIYKAKSPDDVLYNKFQLTSSSYTQNKLNEFDMLDAHIRDSLLALKQKCLKTMDNFLTDAPRYNMYEDTLAELEQKLRTSPLLTFRKFMQTNNNTIIVPYKMAALGDFFNDHLLYAKVLNHQSDEVKQSKYYEVAANLVSSVDKIYKGGQIPQLYGNDLNGKPFQGDPKSGKLTLINFWASWCGPCRSEIPDLKNVYNSFNNKGFNIISVSIDEDIQAWKKASVKEQLPWRSISESVDQNDSKNIENFVVKELPTNYLINGRGEIISRNITIDSLRVYLKRQFSNNQLSGVNTTAH